MNLALQSKQQLKSPDQFVTVMQKAGNWLKTYKRPTTISIIAVVLIIIIIAIVNYFLTSGDVKATSTLSEALLVDSAKIKLKATKNNPQKQPDEEEGNPLVKEIVFDSIEKRSEEALKGYEKVAKQYNETTGVGLIAIIGLAHNYFNIGEYEKAFNEYKRFYKNINEIKTLEGIAIEGMGSALEAQEKYREALEEYKKLEKVDKTYALLSKYYQGRMYAKLGETSKAVQYFRTIIDEVQTSRNTLLTDPYVIAQAREMLSVLAPSEDRGDPFGLGDMPMPTNKNGDPLLPGLFPPDNKGKR